jgi:SAM-dependent methyltransferase
MQRYAWPKSIAPLTEQQKAISDDWMHYWHGILPNKYGLIEKFNHGYPLAHLPAKEYFSTIEVGAGTGGHLDYEDLSCQYYHCVELRENMAEEIRRKFPGVTATVADCQARLPYPDAHFDRAVAVHVLEHLPNLPAAINEIFRVLKTNGMFSVVIPCDPGAAYELARRISSDRIFRKRYKMPYSWLMAREHVNSPREVFKVVGDKFRCTDRQFFPLHIPIVNANLCVGLTYVKT